MFTNNEQGSIVKKTIKHMKEGAKKTIWHPQIIRIPNGY
jgi:hypothetical protein